MNCPPKNTLGKIVADSKTVVKSEIAKRLHGKTKVLGKSVSIDKESVEESLVNKIEKNRRLGK